VQAVEQPIEIGEAGRDAGHRITLRADRLDLIEGGLEQVFEADEVFADPALGDVIDRLLRQVDQIVGVAAAAAERAVTELDDARARLDEPPQHGALADDPAVIGRVRRRRDAGDQCVQVGGATDPSDIARVGERGRHRDHVGRLATAVEVDDRIEDRRMHRPIEVTGANDLDDVGDRVLRQHHAAEHALLRCDILRWGPVELPVGFGRRFAALFAGSTRLRRARRLAGTGRLGLCGWFGRRGWLGDPTGFYRFFTCARWLRILLRTPHVIGDRHCSSTRPPHVWSIAGVRQLSQPSYRARDLGSLRTLRRAFKRAGGRASGQPVDFGPFAVRIAVHSLWTVAGDAVK